MESLLAKAKRAKDHMAAAKADLVDAIQEAEKSKTLTKASKKDSEPVCQSPRQRRSWWRQLLHRRPARVKPRS